MNVAGVVSRNGRNARSLSNVKFNPNWKDQQCKLSDGMDRQPDHHIYISGSETGAAYSKVESISRACDCQDCEHKRQVGTNEYAARPVGS